MPFSSDLNDWMQVQVSVKSNAIDARVKTPGRRMGRSGGGEHVARCHARQSRLSDSGQ